ncbi:MAG: polyribonucleotide nucleotidyltransferase [bacterium]
METKKFKLEIGGRELLIETRNLAEQANGSVTVRYGDTVVLATAVMAKEKKDDLGFFPLTVDYEERYYAAGKIKGPRYIKRETRPSDEAIVTARLIDRTIRPRFPKNLGREVQVVVTCLSWDAENGPATIGVIASSMALMLSDIPWDGPVAAIRVGHTNGNFVINPSYSVRENSRLNLIFGVGKTKGDIVLNMIDGDASEVEEADILSAYDFCEESVRAICAFQEEIASAIGKKKIILEELKVNYELETDIKSFLGDRLELALFEGQDKSSRMNNVNALKKELTGYLLEKYPGGLETKQGGVFLEEEIDRLVHTNAILKDRRVDGRKMDELRPIAMETGVLPRTHGTGLFTRGETRSLSILTLGAPGDQQILEGMEITGKKRFMHHYNFPPYSVGEIKPMRGPGRRDVGHGMLAEKALLPLIPVFEQFPYTIRIVTEILSSNGSSSMASVTSSSIALMDAGVPIKSPATGISIGMMSDGQGNYRILTDIQGPEDHYGDMDFKVAGTRAGITAIQMDVKVSGINRKIMEEALSAAKIVRLAILQEMEKLLSGPRAELSPYAPRILILQINPEKIREVVGPGGKVINEIINATGAAIDIEQSGMIYVTAEKAEAAQKAYDWIKNITREIQVGEIFQGKVKRIMEFGAFTEILPGQEGLVHISQLASYRVNKVEDVVKVGDIIPVKVIEIDELGRINLSVKATSNPEETK